MRIVIVAAPDKRRPTAALRHVARRIFRTFYVAGSVLVLSSFIIVTASDTPGPDLFLLGLGLFCFAYPSIATAVVRRQNRKHARMTFEYEIDDDGLTTRHEHGEARILWAGLDRAEIVSDLLILFVTRQQYLAIPVGMLSAEHRTELRDLLRRRGLLRGTGSLSRADRWTTAGPDHR